MCVCAHLLDSHICACVCACAHVLRVYSRNVQLRESLCVYSRTGDTRTGGTNYSISGWKQLYETGSDSRMRADERRNHRGSQGMLQYMRVARVPPVRPLPPSSCYCCDLMKCYARSPAITFPLHRLTPHSTGFVSRDGTVGHLFSLTIPGATTFIEDFCTSLKAADRIMSVRESLINF